jgi:hypothetical protein
MDGLYGKLPHAALESRVGSVHPSRPTRPLRGWPDRVVPAATVACQAIGVCRQGLGWQHARPYDVGINPVAVFGRQPDASGNHRPAAVSTDRSRLAWVEPAEGAAPVS